MRLQPSPAAPLPAGTSTRTSKGKDKLTLTGLYNVLEALREQRPLTAKEKTIHTAGLVGVLKELHDELDAAVLQAYGLSVSATTDDILSHLVALNQQRAAEETQGTVRWLRPEFQNPAKPATELLSKQELLTQVQQALAPDFAQDVELRPAMWVEKRAMALRGGHHYNDYSFHLNGGDRHGFIRLRCTSEIECCRTN